MMSFWKQVLTLRLMQSEYLYTRRAIRIILVVFLTLHTVIGIAVADILVVSLFQPSSPEQAENKGYGSPIRKCRLCLLAVQFRGQIQLFHRRLGGILFFDRLCVIIS